MNTELRLRNVSGSMKNYFPVIKFVINRYVRYEIDEIGRRGGITSATRAFTRWNVTVAAGWERTAAEMVLKKGFATGVEPPPLFNAALPAYKHVHKLNKQKLNIPSDLASQKLNNHPIIIEFKSLFH